ncbi:hypothetical protein [Methylomicrobium album]|uniref:hypothetical protein n=1 Tax=Methylomicrobium album TaxID=39775 RepID=UPI001BC871E4|nr:hypothetical protein [Methylomicrobium album]
MFLIQFARGAAARLIGETGETGFEPFAPPFPDRLRQHPLLFRHIECRLPFGEQQNRFARFRSRQSLPFLIKFCNNSRSASVSSTRTTRIFFLGYRG